MVTTQRLTAHRDALMRRFASKLELNPKLDRTLVSYQADKTTPLYRWFKYREGFTSSLVHYLLHTAHPTPGTLLDPFAGSGAALFGALATGWQAYGIELLPVGNYIIEARIAANSVEPQAFATVASELRTLDYSIWYDSAYALVTVQVGWSGWALPLPESLFSARFGGKAAKTGRKEGFAGACGPYASS